MSYVRVPVLAAMLASAPISLAQSLTTTFAGGLAAEGVYFEVTALNPRGVTLEWLTLNAVGGVSGYSARLLAREGTFVGHTGDPSGWEMVNATGSSAGPGAGAFSMHPQHANLLLPGQTIAFHARLSSQLLCTPIPPAQAEYSNADIRIRGGLAGGPPGGPVLEGLMGNVTVQYRLGTCWANCDSSTIPPALNVMDFACFLEAFIEEAPFYANCDGSTVAPVLNVLDFYCYLNRFAAGCS